MSPIRIILVDDHYLIRAGIRVMLSALENVEIVGEAEDGLKELMMVGELRPDIVLTDISMPGLSGLEVVARVASQYPQTKSIILSMHAEKEYATKAVRNGASGYLLKDSGRHELELAIRAVARGEIYLSPAVSTHVVADYARRKEAGATPSDPLTHRQREVVKLIAEGHTTKSIARLLDISEKTTETHRDQSLERLGIHDVAGLVRYAIRVGLVKPDE